MLLTPDLPITDALLDQLGFTFALGDDETTDSWTRDAVELWDFNGECWIVNALDQGGIDVEFHTLGQLDQFWRGCQLPPLISDD